MEPEIEDDVPALDLASQLNEQRRISESLASELGAREQKIRELEVRLAEKDHSVQSLWSQLASREAELRKITGSAGWRLLVRYGAIKYRYLLPIYRLLQLLPAENVASRGGATFPPSSKDSILKRLRPTAHPIVLSDQFVETNCYDVICFPIIDWDFRFQRPQQLMLRFAAAGHRVFYIAQNFRPSGKLYSLLKKGHNIYEVSLRGPDCNIYREALDAAACDILFASMDALRRDLSLSSSVAIVQLPFWWPLAEKARRQFAWPVIYDCMDYHAGFSTNQPGMIDQEIELISGADHVVVTSAYLERESCKHTAKVSLLPNACDYDHFADAGTPSGPRPVIGYYGAIADWFDSDLVASLARRNPQWDFVLVGSTFMADTRQLSRLSNVSMPGEQPYSEIPKWLGKFNVAILPFKLDHLTEATNPVKAYEILASGKPLVTVPIPEMISLGSLVHLASTPEEFEQQIAGALKEEEQELVERRRAFARENTWEKRIEALKPVIREIFQKASIIIVTYNNLSLNRLCLNSLYARTEWPNYEVIVVDNHSTDGTAEYLKEAETVFPNLKVILNWRNRGFAAANNIGLKHASGEFIVFLNNDTVLSRGWLLTLIRHLKVDPKIGLISPVTNAIGNEAMIEVGYDKIEEMPMWVADYVRDNDGRLFSIPMVAMFCVAMRRDVFNQVGLLDERFGIGMFEDDDFNHRVRDLGYKIRVARDSFVHHWMKASFNLLDKKKYDRIFEENRKKYQEKWGEPWKAPGIQSRNRPELALYFDQLTLVMERVRASRGVVIFLPSVGWNIHLFQRPHHLARVLAQQGYVSIFDGSNTEEEVHGFEEIEPNLFLFRGPEDVLHEIPNAILWTLPYNFDQKDEYPSTAQVIYDWLDDLEVFPAKRSFLERNHSRALREATLVATVSRRLHEWATAVRPDAIYLPNAVEDARFGEDAVAIPDDPAITRFRKDGKPIAGYYGAIAQWFDYDLLDAVAGLRQDWNFLLIGPRYDESHHGKAVFDRPNVAWIGPRDYTMLPGYLRLFDVATIPFQLNNITLSTSPLKLYEYFAGGKPVVTTALPECEAFPEVIIVRDAHSFSESLDQARMRGGDEKFRSHLRRIAQQNSWTARVQYAMEELAQRIPAGEPMPSALEPHSLQAPVAENSLSTPSSRLSGNAERVAERFHHFLTPQNGHFFNALVKHFAGIAHDPCLPTYFEYAITCNDRGRAVANILKEYIDLNGRRYLDIGCAYGGFLVALAEQGAEVTGLDNDQLLLDLARHNLQDNGGDFPLLLRDMNRATELGELQGCFDVITCNDVIEHVEDPLALLHNISDLLNDKGLAYFEIPNRNFPRFVKQDGHYQLFGITLLDYPEAKEYFSHHAPGVAYGVRHYMDIAEHIQLFNKAGLTLTLLEETFEQTELGRILEDVADLRASTREDLEKVPEPLRDRVAERLRLYLDEVESLPRNNASQKREFLTRFGASFWKVLARKKSS